MDGNKIFEINERQLAIDMRHLVARTGTSHASVHHTLQEQQLYLLSHSVCARVNGTWCTCKTCVLSMVFAGQSPSFHSKDFIRGQIVPH
jgi:hypothetical protein